MTDSAPTLPWLQERTEFGQLPQDVLTAIAFLQGMVLLGGVNV